MFWGWLCLPSSSSGRGSGLLCLPRTRVHLRDNFKLGLGDDLRVCCGLHLRDDFGVCSGFLAFGFHLRDDFRVCSAFLLQGLIFWATLGLHLGGGFRVRFGNTKRIQTIQHNKEKIQRTHTRTHTHTRTKIHNDPPAVCFGFSSFGFRISQVYKGLLGGAQNALGFALPSSL